MLFKAALPMESTAQGGDSVLNVKMVSLGFLFVWDIPRGFLLAVTRS